MYCKDTNKLKKEMQWNSLLIEDSTCVYIFQIADDQVIYKHAKRVKDGVYGIGKPRNDKNILD